MTALHLLREIEFHLRECERWVDGDEAQDRHAQRARLLMRRLHEIEAEIVAMARVREVAR